MWIMNGNAPTLPLSSKQTATKLPQQITAAHNAIKARMCELSQDHMGTAEERKAIEAALSGLNLLSNEVIGPKSET